MIVTGVLDAGGVTSFLPFLEKFFPSVARATQVGSLLDSPVYVRPLLIVVTISVYVLLDDECKESWSCFCKSFLILLQLLCILQQAYALVCADT